MTYEETTPLLDAGFNADEIRAMENKGSEDAKGETDAKEESSAGSAEHESTINASKEIEALTAEVTKLTETVKMLQENNIKNASTGSAKSGADPVNEAINSFIKEL